MLMLLVLRPRWSTGPDDLHHCNKSLVRNWVSVRESDEEGLPESRSSWTRASWRMSGVGEGMDTGLAFMQDCSNIVWVNQAYIQFLFSYGIRHASHIWWFFLTFHSVKCYLMTRYMTRYIWEHKQCSFLSFPLDFLELNVLMLMI